MRLREKQQPQTAIQRSMRFGDTRARSHLNNLISSLTAASRRTSYSQRQQAIVIRVCCTGETERGRPFVILYCLPSHHPTLHSTHSGTADVRIACADVRIARTQLSSPEAEASIVSARLRPAGAAYLMCQRAVISSTRCRSISLPSLIHLLPPRAANGVQRGLDCVVHRSVLCRLLVPVR